MPDDELQCIVEDYSYTTPDGIRRLVTNLAPIYTCNSEQWHLDLSQCNAFDIDAATIISALVSKARRRGQTPRITFPRTPLPAPWCQAWRACPYWLETQKGEDSKLDNFAGQIWHVSQGGTSDCDRIISFMHQHFPLTEETEEYTRICFNEVIQNVEDHARSPIGAMVGAQYIPATGGVQIAIVDCGVGIATTLKERYPGVQDTEEALTKVITGGYSAKSRKNNLGLGVSNTVNIIINQLRGQISILSEDGLGVSSALGWDRIYQLGVRFPGTGISLWIRQW